MTKAQPPMLNLTTQQAAGDYDDLFALAFISIGSKTGVEQRSDFPSVKAANAYRARFYNFHKRIKQENYFGALTIEKRMEVLKWAGNVELVREDTTIIMRNRLDSPAMKSLVAQFGERLREEKAKEAGEVADLGSRLLAEVAGGVLATPSGEVLTIESPPEADPKRNPYY